MDGVRIDSAALLAKDPALPESAGPSPYTDRDDVHDIYRAWRKVADEYPGRVLIGEVWLPDTAAARPLPAPGRAAHGVQLPLPVLPLGRRRAARGHRQHAGVRTPPVGAPATWVLSNHDVDRHVTRYGRSDTSFGLDRREHSQPVDLDLGTRRARAAALLTLALPGSVYLYQGEELGLREVEDIPDELRQDPMLAPDRRRRPRPGRLPGAAALVRRRAAVRLLAPRGQPEPWLPQPAQWRDLTVEAQDRRPRIDAGALPRARCSPPRRVRPRRPR